jgi:hypothetical protein
VFSYEWKDGQHEHRLRLITKRKRSSGDGELDLIHQAPELRGFEYFGQIRQSSGDAHLFP